MDSLGISLPPVISPAPSLPAPVPAVAPQPAVPFVPIGTGDTEAYDPESAEQQRLQTVQRLSQKISDIFVVSDRTFTIFKDPSGQYITRFTSLRDGKVTYIPEPNLFRMGGESENISVKIKA